MGLGLEQKNVALTMAHVDFDVAPWGIQSDRFEFDNVHIGFLYLSMFGTWV